MNTYGNYAHRILSCTAAVLLGLILLVRLFPSTTTTTERPLFPTMETPVLFDEVLVTRQTLSPPPPQIPRIPAVVPKDVIDEPELDLEIDTDVQMDPLPEEGVGTGQEGWESRLVLRPGVRPRVLKIVEPTKDLPALADLGSDIRVTVEFIVSETGDVLEVSVVAIDSMREGEATPLPELDRLALEAIIDAAKQWKFRPASHEGRPVPAPSTQIFFL